jgi:hypothetical protein
MILRNPGKDPQHGIRIADIKNKKHRYPSQAISNPHLALWNSEG